LLQGVSLTFDNQGYVETKEYFHVGNLQGEYLVYKRKRIVERRSYQAGILSGMLRKYYDNGNLMQEVPYVENQIDGIGKWYDQEGNMSIAYRYEKGELVDKNPNLGE
jgi:antitoxin component YwqK of YwqJK toxin-antitoxin module